MKLSIIIPVFNEEKTIKEVIDKLLKVKLPYQKEIIVVDDGSTDATASEIKNLKFKIKNLKVVNHKINQGKGAAVRTGIDAATGDYILIQDADLEYNPAEIPKLLSPLLKLTTNNKRQTTNYAVYGSRFMSRYAQIPYLYLLGNKFLTWITNVLYGTRLTDMETGYKLLPASVFKKIKLTGKRFEIEPEITVRLIKNSIPIIEVPISYKGRNHLSGKKLTLKDAFSAVKVLFFPN